VQAWRPYLRKDRPIDLLEKVHKNLLGDEIANVNFFTTNSHTYFKIPKKKTYFV